MAVAKRFKIKHPELGMLAGTYAHDWETGATAYDVTAVRVRGVFTVHLNPIAYKAVGDPGYGTHYLDPDRPSFMVLYGRSVPGQRPDWGAPYQRKDRPIVNGVQLVGATGVNPDRLRFPKDPQSPYLGRWYINCRRSADDWGGDTEAPEATAERTALVIDALVRHWMTRPENYALRLATCRFHAARNDVDVNIRAARRRLAEAREELICALAYARDVRLHTAAPPAGPPQMRELPGETARERPSARRGVASGPLRDHLGETQ